MKIKIFLKHLLKIVWLEILWKLYENFRICFFRCCSIVNFCNYIFLSIWRWNLIYFLNLNAFKVTGGVTFLYWNNLLSYFWRISVSFNFFFIWGDWFITFKWKQTMFTFITYDNGIVTSTSLPCIMMFNKDNGTVN